MENNLNLQEYFEAKNIIEKMLEDTLAQKLKDLLAIVPKELNTYFSESIFDANWLKHLYSNTITGSNNSDKIKDPQIYGFKNSKADVVRKMNLLKEAWKGIVDVDIDSKSWYVEVRFRMVLKK